MYCQVKYSSDQSGDLKSKILTYFKTGNFDEFKNSFTKETQGQNVIYRIDPENPIFENNKILQDFWKDFTNIINEFRKIAKNPSKIDEFLQEVMKVLNIELDETQGQIIAEEELVDDFQSRWSRKDENETNLDKHFDDFYGSGSYDLKNSLKLKFKDDISKLAYFDFNTGALVNTSNVALLKNIQQYKNKLYKTIIKFLQLEYSASESIQSLKDSIYSEDGVNSKYFDVMLMFYNYVQNYDSDRKILNALHNNRILNTNTSKKEDLYKKLTNVLYNDPYFGPKWKTHFETATNATTQKDYLYQSGIYSEGFTYIKKLLTYDYTDDGQLKPVNELLLALDIDGQNVLEIVDEIEGDTISFIDAAEAYSILTHFDELLESQLHDAFVIDHGSDNVLGNTYSYNFESTNKRVGWNTSTEILAEKYTADVVTAVLNMIKIYDYKTSLPKNQRLDTTTLIMSATNLITDVLMGNFDYVGKDSKSRKEGWEDFLRLIVDFHNNPTKNFGQILKYLFSPTKASVSGIAYNLAKQNLVKDSDLNLLFSLYHVVYNERNPKSLYNIFVLNLLNHTGSQVDILSEISSYIDRNTTISYLESEFDADAGIIKTKVKRRFNNQRDLYKTRLGINTHIKDMSKNMRQNIRQKYNFTQASDTSGHKRYSIILPKDFRIDVLAPGSMDILIAGGIKFSNANEIKELAAINLGQFRQKLKYGESLTTLESRLYDVLEFLDETLGLGILENQELNLQALEYLLNNFVSRDGTVGSTYLESLLALGIRSAYIIDQNLNAGDKSLASYLTLTNDPAYNAFLKNPKKSKLFTNKFYQLQYHAVNRADNIIELLTDAVTFVSGEANKATVKDKEGATRPNNSVQKLGTNYSYYLEHLVGTNANSLMFVKNPTLITGTLHDLSVTSASYKTKSIRNLTVPELYFHSIFNKFYGSYLNGKHRVIILPTVYSDKTTFLNYEVVVDDVLMTSPRYKDLVAQRYIDTIGSFYKNSWQATKDKLSRIYNHVHHLNGDIKTINEFLHTISENELNKLAKEVGVKLELDKDYRKVGGGTAINETLLYYAETLYQDPKYLKSFLKKQEFEFVLMLVDSNSIFLILGFELNYETFISDKPIPDKLLDSHNPILNTILLLFKNDAKGRAAFFKDWVDEKTGLLIIAKLGGKNIINTSIDKSKSVEVNPILEKFMYIEGLLSNNLRMSLTGSEINHPDKAFNTEFSKLKDAVKKLPEGLVLSKLTVKEITGFNVVDTIGLTNTIKSATSVADLNGNPDSVIQSIYEHSLLSIINTALGTQFKRNVIIPATLLYVTRNSFVGIPTTVKCAVIRDEKADVFNYRGDHEKPIDAADGSARITAFLSILENLALGSLSVGFTKKPIWHAYDPENGTAFLAKFATNTITNEEMRASQTSHSSLYRLFKKMTNLQWLGDVDLLLTISDFGKISPLNRKNEHITYFQSLILGNKYVPDAEGNLEIKMENRLIYDDITNPLPNGKQNKREIIGVSRTLDGIYYTEELAYSEKFVFSSNSKRVFHVFDAQSNHYTFNSSNDAKKFIEANLGAHSINSLFELYNALGGLNCIDGEGKGSEFINFVVARFMNYTGTINEGVDSKKELLTQENTNQVLKKYQIGYALNNTAVKNGAKCINDSSRWSNDEDLDYFEVDSSGLGMQMDADHDIEDSEITEFSLVITATSAYGYTEGYTSEIFYGLASAAIQSSSELVKSTQKFLNENNLNPTKAKSDLYDAIGRILFSASKILDRESLTNVILQAVNQVFVKNKVHTNDDLKIPFSDPNIYSLFISSLASSINRESIKRKHPGSGCVLVPGYNTMMYFEDASGNKKMSGDILLDAQLDYRLDLINWTQARLQNSPKSKERILYVYDGDVLKSISVDGQNHLLSITSTSELRDILGSVVKYLGIYKDIPSDLSHAREYFIRQYLLKLLDVENQSTMDNAEWFMPSDIVEMISEEGVDLGHFNLNSMENYYNFKFGVDEKSKDPFVTLTDEGYIIRNAESLSELQLVHALAVIPEGGTILDNGFISLHLKDNPILNGFIEAKEGSIIEENGTTTKVVTYKRRHIKFARNVTQPRNLRPSLIRWKYTLDGVEHTMNIFDTDVIKNSYKGNRSPRYRNEIQRILNSLHSGNSPVGEMVQGSLENNEAELIMSNIYRERFDTGSDSLSTILSQGVEYFGKKANKISAPSNFLYNIAFLRDSGSSTLIRIGDLGKVKGGLEMYTPFNNNQLMTTSDNDVYLMKGNLKKFKVGKWVKVNGGVSYKDGKFYNAADELISNLDEYKLEDSNDPTSVMKYVLFVRLYEIMMPRKGKSGYFKNTLYQIIPIGEMESLTGFSNKDCVNLIGKIISDVYNDLKYKVATLNPNMEYKEGKADINLMRNVLTNMIETTSKKGNKWVDHDVKQMLQEQLLNLSDNTNKNRKFVQEQIAVLLDKFANKQWASFQDSLKFIAARIPAQSLQSFMAMKCVAWTENSKNMAYVSHFLTYLLGSDYDIDKTYIMGLSYDRNGVYVGWSPLFNNSTYKTLQASKTLPIPKFTINKETGEQQFTQLSYSSEGLDITSEINQLANILDPDLTYKSNASEDEIINAIQIIKRVLLLTKNNNKVKYDTKQQFVVNLINDHLSATISASVAEAAFKNVASANIFNVIHDIRNRDLAYTPIEMDMMRSAAKNSPKGNLVEGFNMFNPLTKYAMLYLNLVGKDVISITANGEKVWFNIFWYFTNIIKYGTDELRDSLKFSHTFKRIHGRAKNKPETITKTTIPDLNPYDLKIKDWLMTELGITEEDAELYAYVDLTISLLLSAATDNAKELLLDRINAGTNFSRMYLYGIIMGFNLDDLVAFMTSPIAGFIDNVANLNIFSYHALEMYPNIAISIAEGHFSYSNFLHGKLPIGIGEEEKYVAKSTYIFQKLQSLDVIKKAAESEGVEKYNNLYEALAGITKYVMKEGVKVQFSDLLQLNDMECNSFMSYVDNMLSKMYEVRQKYKGEVDPYQAYLDDVAEFKLLYEYATELTQIASGQMGLNLGLPTSELDIIKRLINIAKPINSAESKLGISKNMIKHYKDALKKLQEKPDDEKALKEVNEGEFIQAVDAIVKNNPFLNELKVRDLLFELEDIVGNFDTTKFVTDKQYRARAIKYNNLVKLTFNGLDMLDTLPLYNAILELLSSLLTANNKLCSKTRAINEILRKNKKLSNIEDSELKGIIRYVDLKNIYDYVTTEVPAIKTSILIDGKNYNSGFTGVDGYFREREMPIIHFKTQADMGSFKLFVENDLFDALKEAAKDRTSRLYKNGFIRHLKKVPDEDQYILATDIKLLNPNVTMASRLAYNEIINGFLDLTLISYQGDIKIGDLFYLYNLIVNHDLFGDERFTTIFLNFKDSGSIQKDFFLFLGNRDYDESFVMSVNRNDYEVASAPLINSASERFHKEPYVKVKDDIEGYKIKKYDSSNNEYKEIPLLPRNPSPGESSTEKYARYARYLQLSTFDMPFSLKSETGASLLSEKVTDENRDELVRQLTDLLKDFSVSNLIVLYKDC